MKHLLLLLSMLAFCAQFSFSRGVTVDSLAVTMDGYQQELDDGIGRLTLRNNTKEPVRNILFQMYLYDLDSTLLSVGTMYKGNVDIAPLATKQVDLPAFLKYKRYSYYTSATKFEDRSFQVRFRLLGYNDSSLRSQLQGPFMDLTKYDSRVYDVVEQMPFFPGGPDVLRKYIQDHIDYPDLDKYICVMYTQGRVIVSFVVEPDGSLSTFKVTRSLDPWNDKEALRVVRGMPHWIPGKQNGVPVRVRYSVPVSFYLQ